MKVEDLMFENPPWKSKEQECEVKFDCGTFVYVMRHSPKSEKEEYRPGRPYYLSGIAFGKGSELAGSPWEVEVEGCPEGVMEGDVYLNEEQLQAVLDTIEESQ